MSNRMFRVLRTAIILGCALAIALPSLAEARTTIALDSAVFVERTAAGKGRMLQPAARLSRGDRVVYVLSWKREAGSGGFVVTNPLPHSVYFQDTARDGTEVSIDGGRTWGELETMRVGGRMATPEDVTHVRWRVAANEAAQGSGQIAWSAIVR